MKVTARHDLAGLGEHHRVIGSPRLLFVEDVVYEAERLTRGTVHLGDAAHRIAPARGRSWHATR